MEKRKFVFGGKNAFFKPNRVKAAIMALAMALSLFTFAVVAQPAAKALDLPYPDTDGRGWATKWSDLSEFFDDSSIVMDIFAGVCSPNGLATLDYIIYDNRDPGAIYVLVTVDGQDYQIVSSHLNDMDLEKVDGMCPMPGASGPRGMRYHVLRCRTGLFDGEASVSLNFGASGRSISGLTGMSLPNGYFSVTYDVQGGSWGYGDRHMEAHRAGAQVGVIVGEPVLEGYCFMGWESNVEGHGSSTGMVFAGGDSFEMPGHNVTLKAIWIDAASLLDKGCTVTFDSNGGDSGAVPGEIFVPVTGDTVGDLPEPPTRGGYEFLGWNTEPNGTGAAFTAGTPVAFDITVYAQWAEVEPQPAAKYTVTVNNSYADPAATGAGEYEAGDSVTINAGARSGYAFNGWVVDEGGATLDDSGNASALFEMPEGDVTVTARWTANTPPLVAVSPGPEITEDDGDDGDDGDENENREPPDDQTPGGSSILGNGAGENGYEGDPPAQQGNISQTQHVPGGNDQFVPPNPTVPGRVLVPTEEGTFIELDDFGVPLGEWWWDDPPQEWVFDEYDTPLGEWEELPQTGDGSNAVEVLLLVGGLMLVGIGAALWATAEEFPKRKNDL